MLATTAAALANELENAVAPAIPESGAGNSALLLWDYTMFGVAVWRWSLTPIHFRMATMRR